MEHPSFGQIPILNHLKADMWNPINRITRRSFERNVEICWFHVSVLWVPTEYGDFMRFQQTQMNHK